MKLTYSARHEVRGNIVPVVGGLELPPGQCAVAVVNVANYCLELFPTIATTIVCSPKYK